MTKLFESAVETARSLSPEAQDALARIVLQLARENDLPSIAMGVEDETSFDESMAEAERGEFVSEARFDLVRRAREAGRLEGRASLRER